MGPSVASGAPIQDAEIVPAPAGRNRTAADIWNGGAEVRAGAPLQSTVINPR
jgi:hypothetical protein